LFTFDGTSYLEFIRSLRSTPTDHSIKAPSFSHSLKDPVQDSISILPRHKLVVVEGLWVGLNSDGVWKQAAEEVDERWVVLPESPEEGRRRLIERHIRTEVEDNLEAAIIRADTSDIPNGEYALNHLLEPVRRVVSVEDLSFLVEGIALEEVK